MEVSIDVKEYYEKYFPMVLRRCRCILISEEDALDAAQDVFIKLMRRRGSLKGEYPSSLLYTMATNTALNTLRWKRNRREALHEDGEAFPGHIDRAYEHIDAKLLVEDLLNAESETTRIICFMYHWDTMTLEEIGMTLGMSVSGVRKRLASFQKRARKRAEREAYND
ncbi:MAG: sigma-70 family RNA polymerase sigma factor [Spirochaetaceae bacterium]|jgi:RNA polymerase sigma-70 factor (ECF subfamily)|nr:sigma-70 family RNA polymerase sigma factor [Spirochaetaceae bacterium]